MPDGFLLESLMRYVGQTVTIFTTSGGLSGFGFTGVLAGICDGTVKLITDIGAAPACPVGSACTCGTGFGGGFGYGFGFGGGYGNGFGGGFGYGNGSAWNDGGFSCGCGCGNGNNWLGSVTEIPVSCTKWNRRSGLYFRMSR